MQGRFIYIGTKIQVECLEHKINWLRTVKKTVDLDDWKTNKRYICNLSNPHHFQNCRDPRLI